MTEERSCKTCGLSSSNNGTGKLCRYFGETCNDYNYFSKWQPIAQEKPIEKIQMTEEQARRMFDDCIEVRNDPHCDVVNESVFNAKQKGYIRKTALEEAEEMYKEGLNRIGDMSENVVMEMDKMYSAIQEFKSEIARLKG